MFSFSEIIPLVETVFFDDEFRKLKPLYRFPLRQCFQCNCGKWYSNRATLNRHQRYECGKEPMFECPYCPKKCKRKSNLSSHIRIRHKDVSLLQHVQVESST